MSNDALVQDYMQSGAALVDRAASIAERDAQELERGQTEELANEQEVANDLADEAALALG